MKLNQAFYFPIGFLLSSMAVALPSFSFDPKNLAFSVAAGPNWSHGSDSTLVISPYETDSLFTQHASRGGLFKMGAGYHFFRQSRQGQKFFSDLLVELNLYHQSTTLSGNSWEYQLPQFNNYDFTAPISTTRLMLDVKPQLFRWHQASFYPIVGLGAAWNNFDQFNEVATSADADSALSLTGHTRVSFAYDLGAGLSAPITSHLKASLEYLYANSGNASTSDISSSPATLMAGPQFSLSSQSLLLGLTWELS